MTSTNHTVLSSIALLSTAFLALLLGYQLPYEIVETIFEPLHHLPYEIVETRL